MGTVKFISILGFLRLFSLKKRRKIIRDTNKKNGTIYSPEEEKIREIEYASDFYLPMPKFNFLSSWKK